MHIKFQYSLSVVNKQQGAALITALVFMGILTMLGISAMRSNTLDIKIHNAMKDRSNAFQCAEAALRQGEIFIQNANGRPLDDGDGSSVPSQSLTEVWAPAATTLNDLVNQNASWWTTNGWADAVLSDTDLRVGCANSANYIVQSLGGIGNESGCLSFECLAKSQTDGYRISSRSEGVSSNAMVILQSTFTRKFN